MAKPALSRRATAANMIGGDPPSEKPSRKRGFPTFSLRRLLYSSPLVGRRLNRAADLTSVAPPPTEATPSVSPSRQQDATRTPPPRPRPKPGDSPAAIRTPPPPPPPRPRPKAGDSPATRTADQGDDAPTTASPPVRECPLCLFEMPSECFPELLTCAHRSCYDCFQKYLHVEISESRVHVVCPECSEPMHPSDIRMILNDKVLFEKYEDFMVRRVLACDPDTRWCPAPDCSFAVIAAGCASCPKIKCERPGCASHFCYHCKAEWHPNQTCDAARAQRSPNARSSSFSYCSESQHQDELKPCPRCQILIVKINDGSCNHMKCSVCGVEFCWLCMKEVTDLHFLSPSGCTFWGKKPWSRKKKILWQLGTLVGAPVGIGLVAGIAVPAMIIGIPVWVGKKLYRRYKYFGKHKRNLYIVGGITAAIIVAPLLAALAVAIGAPILLFYVYGVVPVSMCRSGGCGGGGSSSDSRSGGSGTASRSGDEDPQDAFIDGDLVAVISEPKLSDDVSVEVAGATNPSIGEVSLSLSGSSNLERLGREGTCDRDPDAELDRPSASNVAVAGASLLTRQRLDALADVVLNLTSETASAVTNLSDDGAASTRALAGSVLNWRSDSASGVLSVDEVIMLASSTGAGDRLRLSEAVDILEEKRRQAGNADGVSMAAVGGSNPSIGQVSLSLSGCSNLERLGRDGTCDRDDVDGDLDLDRPSAGSLSTGLQMRLPHDETASAVTNFSDDAAASTRALAGSVLNWRSDSASEVLSVDEDATPTVATAATTERVRFNETVDILHETNKELENANADVLEDKENRQR